MHLSNIVATAAIVYASFALAFDCSSKELQEFNFDNIKGVHAISSSENTPPSESELKWYFNICGSLGLSKNKNNYPDVAEVCQKDSQICGVKYLKLPGQKEPLRTEIIDIADSLRPEISINKEFPNPNKQDQNTTSINVKLSGTKWGSRTISSSINFICDNNVNDDPKNDKDNIKLKKWDNTDLEIEWYSSTICAKDGNKKPDDGNKKPDDGKKPTDDNNKGSSSFFFGFFKFIFNIFFVVVFLYIIGAIYLTISGRGGTGLSFRDTIDEVTQFLVDIGRSVPGFIKEILEKFFGNSASRGGYSAV